MEYLLKTSNVCSNNCSYCEYLNKKAKKQKTLNEVKKELLNIIKKGYDTIKLACNTDNRPDFLEILKFLKENNIKIILETNGRIFSHKTYLARVNKYIDKYELFFSMPTKESAMFINITGDGFFEQSILGIKNIINILSDKNNLLIKTVILNENLANLKLLIDNLSLLDVRQIKFIYPFKLHEEDPVPSMSWTAKSMTLIQKYSRQNGIKVIIGDELDYNPYITETKNFLDINKAKLKKEYKLFKKSPHFSIIIPTQNRTTLLRLVLESFFNQHFEKEDYEIIIIDDGGNNTTEKMINKLKPTCNLKYIYWPREKVNVNFDLYKYAAYYNRAGLTRNIGIKYSKGNVLLFNDDDTLVEEFCLKKHNAYHKEYDNIIVRGFRMFLPDTFRPNKSNVIDFDNLKSISTPEEPLKERTKSCRLYNLSNEGWKRVISSNLSFKKKDIDKLSGFNNDSPFWGYEDVEFGYRAKLAGFKFMWDDNIKVFHLPHKKQTGNDYQTIATFWINTNIFYRKYFDEDIYKLYRAIIMRRLDNSVLPNN